jgi:hypothetical protein
VKTLLLEEIYSRPELKQIDKLFDEILEVLPSDDFKHPIFKKNFKKMEGILKRVFNIHCKIFLDLSLNKYITYGMAIYPSYEEMKNQYLDAIETKNGFKLINSHNVSIEIESNLLNYFKEKNLNGRDLTAIIIHEIGHKVYVKTQRDIYFKEFNEKRKAIIIGTASSSVTIPLALVNPIVTFVGLAMVFFGTNTFLDYIRIKNYSNREIYSDSLAVKYGYGAEIYRVLKILQEEDNRMHKKSNIRFIDWIRKNFNFYYLRRKGIIEVLKKEYEETKSPIQKKYIKKMINDLLEQQNKDFNEKNDLI